MKRTLWIIIIIIALLIIAYLFATVGDDRVEDDDDITNLSLVERAQRAGLSVTENSILVDLSEQNDSEISGIAVLTELDNVQTEVNVWLDDEGTTPRPAHIHLGSCPTPGDVVYPLTNVTDQISNTTIATNFEALAAQAPLAINAHESAENPGNYIACGNIDFGQDSDDDDSNATTSDNGNNEAETVTVRYMDTGFEPQNITVDSGDTVMWVNESTNDMWVASAMHPTHSVFDGTTLSEHCPNPANDAFDQCANTDEYSFTFTQEGEWAYHNHSLANHFGRVTVE
jgi:plastocyanin